MECSAFVVRRGVSLFCMISISLRNSSYFMRQHRSPRAQSILKVGAYHFLFNCLLGSAVVAYFAYMLLTMILMESHDETLIYWGVAAVIAWVISVGVFCFRGYSLKCSLCMNPVWGKRMCQKHSKAKPALGMSYRLGIATTVVFKNRYRCPYCGEPFSAAKAKARKPTTPVKNDRHVRSIR